MLPPITILFFLNALVYTFTYFLIASGLSLIFGTLGILNVAHGALYMFGAYTAVTLIRLSGINPILQFSSLIVAAFLVGLIGIAIEMFLLRLIYKRGDVYQLLLTFGLALASDDIVKLGWGLTPQAASEPYLTMGSINVFGMLYPNYNFVIISGSVSVALLLLVLLFRTWLGRIIRATSMNKELALGIGVNASRVFTYTYAIGAIIAGLAGSLIIPSTAASPGIGTEVIAISFSIVAIGGLGSLKGVLVGSLIIGFLRSIGVFFFPEVELMLIYLVTAAVLLIRPSGIFGRRRRV